MIRTVRTRRLALFAATTAVAAGALLVPTTSFAATPAGPHAAAADDGDRGGSRKDHRGQWKKDGTWGKKRPGKGGSDGGVHTPKNPDWQCITAPCGPPDKGGPKHGKHRPEQPQWQCITAPCGPPGSAGGGRHPHH